MILDLQNSAANLSFAKGGKPENSERGCTYGILISQIECSEFVPTLPPTQQGECQ